jgi:methyl-accepting chemotaxis protein
MKKNTVIYQMISRIAILLCIVGSLTIFVTYFIIKLELENYQQEEIDTASNIVVQAMKTTQSSTQTIEHLIDARLLAASKGIAQALQGKAINEISREELIQLKEYWALYDISLFVREGEDIVVAQSSDENEIGLSTKEWGYWYTAFDQLMSGKAVSVDKGHGEDNYWVGPISKSEWENKYFKYAYYYDERSSILINPYVLDEEIYRLTFDSGPTQMIRNIISESLEIEEIAVINVPALLKGTENSVIEPEYDRPILYGSNSISLPKDTEMIEAVVSDGVELHTSFKHKGKELKKFYIPISDNRVLTVVTNLKRQQKMEKKIITLLITAFLLAFIAIFLLIRIIAKRQLEPLKEIAEHIHNLSKGDLTKVLHIKENNEWGWLAGQINEMTNKMNHLILDIKKEAHSVLILSSLLSKQAYTSTETMDEASINMTNESKTLLVDLSSNIETLRKTFDTFLKDLNKLNVDKEVKENIEGTINMINQKLQYIETYTETHASNVTEIKIMFSNTLDELRDAILQMDHLSTSLENKIKVFQVRDHSGS